jgi:penicillin-binding protein 1A
MAGSPKSPDAPPDRRRSRWRRIVVTLLALPPLLVAIGLALAALATLLINDRLPPLDALIEYKPRIPLRVLSADGVMIGEYGEERRTFVPIAEVPDLLKHAIVAAEDSRFFDHVGIDLVGVARAALANLASGGTEQGASTITMQLAREFFLSPERTYTRKLVEILIALRIEDTLSKEQILELYINQIFLGKRAYGFAAAAQTYFGKPLAAVSAAEAAMLAGLPKAPSRFNPFVNPRRATERQRYILRRMREIGFLSESDYQAALNEPLKLASQRAEKFTLAPYVAEAARQAAWEIFKQDTYSAGIVVHTTINAAEQRAANEALRKGVLEYDRRYGYRGPESFIELSTNAARAREQITDAIDDAEDVEGFSAAVVLQASTDRVVVSNGGPNPITIRGEGLRFASGSLGESATAARRLRRGAVIRISETKPGQFAITQLPEVEAALVAVSPEDGAVRAMVGGFDYGRNKFNRVTQAWRQPGSSFKPFIFSAAFDKGFMTGSVLNDAPIRIDPKFTGNQLWEPRNYDNRFEGPMSLREAMARSKNMVSIRLLDAIGPDFAQQHIARFGFDRERHPAFLTMALGAGSTTPWQMAGAYSVIANGGYRVEPYLISHITDGQGRTLAQARPMRAGDETRRAIDTRNAFMVDSLLMSVIETGTGARAQALKRKDLAGKTGTTNDAHDAWFAGYHPRVAAVVWVGYDQPRRLGERETGGGLALPIWMEYMQRALQGVPESPRRPPPGLEGIDGDFYYAGTLPANASSQPAPSSLIR